MLLSRYRGVGCTLSLTLIFASLSLFFTVAMALLTRFGCSSMPLKYKLGKHRSNALDLIQKVEPIEVEGDMAVCDGGGGALGHPLEYIKVGYRGGEPVSCVYCGLRYVQKGAH